MSQVRQPNMCHQCPIFLHLQVPTQALGTGILPLLWAHLARSMGLPLEAPKQAKRGWSIAALQRGAQSLAPQHAALLGLFCRSVCLSGFRASLPLGRDCCEAPQDSPQPFSAYFYPSDASGPDPTVYGPPQSSADQTSEAPFWCL